ncbi:putative WRKY transcription factor 12 [Hibiscus syriacus]|uniref:WRKY transcription factor 12 n=1 Tax=Hibiscus syriacus TaxID=106335 RepID=A0A6A3AF85_HIBSY|nr:probable WRKY transcription factor 50 [Hibiscus syriacus]KAE8701845.1 putative WRKY transcription factor 12 [Hibiscus syriacus]
MSTSNITTTTTFLTPSSHPNHICTHTMELNSNQLDFEDLLLLPDQPQTCTGTASITSCLKPYTTLSPVNGGCWAWEVPSNHACVDYMLPTNEGYVQAMEREDVEKYRIAFRIKSGLEVMDDGYKWKKYGKKKIKSNPYPRHYYRCSREECKVKKRVEREGEDGVFVITTYEGKHNHESPATSAAALDISRTL